MDTTGVKRPTGITVTAWVWIVMGGLMIFSAVMGMFAYTMMGQMGSAPFPQEMPNGVTGMNSFFKYFGVLLVAQGIVAVVAIWAGFSLLRLRPWARTTLEILSWLGFLYTVGFGILWIYSWISMSGHAPAHNPSPHSFQLMGAVMGMVVIAVFAGPLWIMIRYLRGPEARAAIAK